jgi:hypothetical protein
MKNQATKTELQKDVAELRESGKKIYQSISNIAKDLDWKDYLAIGLAGAAVVYGIRKKEFITTIAAPALLGLFSNGMEKAKEIKEEVMA